MLKHVKHNLYLKNRNMLGKKCSGENSNYFEFGLPFWVFLGLLFFSLCIINDSQEKNYEVFFFEISSLDSGIPQT